MRRGHREVQLQVLVQRNLDEPVDAVRRRGADLVDDVVVAVVHDRLGSGLARELGLLGTADGRNHMARLLEARELDRGVPDGAGAAGDQDVPAAPAGRRRSDSRRP